MSASERIALTAGSGAVPGRLRGRGPPPRRRGGGRRPRGETAPELVHYVHAIAWCSRVSSRRSSTRSARSACRAPSWCGIGEAAASSARSCPTRGRSKRSRGSAASSATTRCLRGLADELDAEGIRIVSSTTYLDEIVPAAGVLGTRAPTEQERADIRRVPGREGHRALRHRPERVVRGGTVMAVEGIEGPTRRSGALGRRERRHRRREGDEADPGPPLRPARDRAETIRTLAEVRGRALAIEAGRRSSSTGRRRSRWRTRRRSRSWPSTWPRWARDKLRAYAVVGVATSGASTRSSTPPIPTSISSPSSTSTAISCRAVATEVGTEALVDHRSCGPRRLRQRRREHGTTTRSRASSSTRASTSSSRAAHDDGRRRPGAARARRPRPARAPGRPSRALQPGDPRDRGDVTQPRFIECQRLAPFTERGTDVDVVLDVMIHDIDLLLAMVPSPLRAWSRRSACPCP